MSIENDLASRSENKCELCSASENLNIFEVPPSSDGSADQSVLICETCKDQIENPDNIDVHHWRCLGDSMWTPVPAVQVMAWRMLKSLNAEPWARDLMDMLYLDEETEIWAKAMGSDGAENDVVKHIDSNGAILEAGDTVVLIKDLNVKGAGFTAKRGTAVRNISLVSDNELHIEGRVEGQQIVILTEFVKKSK